MLARKWAIQIHGPFHSGILYVDTRREGRRLMRSLKFMGLQVTLDRTGI